MRINFDRLSQLAGLPANGKRTGLYESKDNAGHEKDEMKMEMDHGHKDEMTDEMREEDDADEMFHMEKDDPTLDEVIEVDEAMLVQELRRAKRIMQENKRRQLNESRKKNIFEAQLRQVIDEEVQNVMHEMNITGDWVYGNRKPRRSKKGYTHQGSMLPGLGFRR